MDGFAVLEEALQTPRLSSTLFVSYSGYMKEADYRWLGYIGFDANITKDSTPAMTMVPIIRNLLSSKWANYQIVS